MGTRGRGRSTDPATRLAALIAELQRTGRLGAVPRGLIIPVRDADPPADDPTNLWGFDDGRLRWRGTDGVVHEILPRYPILTRSANPSAASGIDFWLDGSSRELRVRAANGVVVRFAPISGGTSTESSDLGGVTGKAKVVDKQPHTHRVTYAATWGRTLCPVHGAEVGGTLNYGRWSSTHGQRKVMIGFNDDAIRSDLTAFGGASVKRVELHARNVHAYLNSGITIRWGGHNRDDPPGSYSAVRRNVFADHWPKVGDGAAWHGGRGDITWLGRAFRDNQIKGLVIDQLSDAVTFYGAIDWSSVRIRITYRHTH